MPSIPTTCYGAVTPTPPPNDKCNDIYNGSTYNTGSRRCEIDPTHTCDTNYTYDSKNQICNKNRGVRDSGPDTKSPTLCPPMFQLNNSLSVPKCETTDANNPLNTCMSNPNTCCPTPK